MGNGVIVLPSSSKLGGEKPSLPRFATCLNRLPRWPMTIRNIAVGPFFSFLRCLVCSIHAVEASEHRRKGGEAGTVAFNTSFLASDNLCHLPQADASSLDVLAFWFTARSMENRTNAPFMFQSSCAADDERSRTPGTARSVSRRCIRALHDGRQFLFGNLVLNGASNDGHAESNSSRANRLERAVGGKITISGCTSGISQLLRFV